VQLTQGRTDSTGTTGLAIIRALVAGGREPVPRARVRDPRCAHRTAEIAQAVTGHERAAQVLARQQALALDDISPIQGREGDVEIERHVHASTPRWSDEPPPLARERAPASPSQKAPA
jgi:transposase